MVDMAGLSSTRLSLQATTGQVGHDPQAHPRSIVACHSVADRLRWEDGHREFPVLSAEFQGRRWEAGAGDGRSIGSQEGQTFESSGCTTLAVYQSSSDILHRPPRLTLDSTTSSDDLARCASEV